MNLGRMLAESAGKYPENVAVIHGGHRITYRELERAACALTNHLRALGLNRGDKLAIMLPNCPEFIIAYFTAGAGPSSTTLPMQIYAMIRFGVTPEINAMATIVMAVAFIALFTTLGLFGAVRSNLTSAEQGATAERVLTVVLILLSTGAWPWAEH